VQCRKSEIYTEIIITTEHYFSLRMEIWLNIDMFYFASTATNRAKKRKSTFVNIQKKNYFTQTTRQLCAKTW
jgi:plasmid maintenance system antidote protein VapI